METEKLEKNLISSIGEAKSLGEVVLDFFSVIAKWRKLIVWFILIPTILAGGIAAISPKWYKSTATVFPAEQTSLFPGLEGVSSLARTLGVGRAIGGISSRTELDRFMAILKSETALMRVIERFNLTNVYEITSYPREKTMKELLSNTNFEVAEEGNLVIEMYDKDPRRVADMANYFVQILNEINSTMQASNAKANREFIEQRVGKNRSDLHAAEEVLKTYQEKSGIMITPDQNGSGVSAVAELYAMKARKEIELAILQRTVSRDHPVLLQSATELEEVNKKVALMPEAGVGTLRLYREVVIQQKIMEFLVPLYEQAKVEEKRSTPSVIVLDRGEVPERKAKPKITLYILLAFVITTILSLFLVFLLEGVDRIRSLQPERFHQMWSVVRSDWFGLRIKRNAN